MSFADLQLPPHNIEAEKWVLCCVLLNNDNLSILDDVWVTSSSFYQKEHKKIMENIEALRFAGRSIDMITLSDCLGNDLDNVWGQLYILELSVYLLTWSVCREYCEILRDNQLRREMIDLTGKINASCYTDRDIAKIISRSIIRFNQMNTDKKLFATDDWLYFPNRSELISWGNDSVNRKFGYMQNDLCVIYATAGMGKTERTCHIADSNGRDWKKVLYYSLELAPRTLKKRSSYSRVWLTKEQFQTEQYNDYQKQKIIENYESFDRFYDLTSCDRDINKMIVDIEKKAKEWYDLIIIDNLGKIKRDGHSEMEVQDRFTSECQDIKNKHKNVTIIIIHHEAKRVLKHVAGSMRWNQKVEDNSTIVVQIRRSKDPDDDHEEKSKVNIEQWKDTEWWVIAKTELYFNKWKYHDEYDPKWNK